MKVTWVCVYEGCQQVFCSRCRRSHPKAHFSQLYSIRDLLEEELGPGDGPSLTENDKETVKDQINGELEATRRRFEHDIEDIKKFLLEKLSKADQETAQAPGGEEIVNLRKNLKRKADTRKLLTLAEKYHGILQESQFEGTLKHSIAGQLEDEIEEVVKAYNADLTKAVEKILGEQYEDDLELSEEDPETERVEIFEKQKIKRRSREGPKSGGKVYRNKSGLGYSGSLGAYLYMCLDKYGYRGGYRFNIYRIRVLNFSHYKR